MSEKELYTKGAKVWIPDSGDVWSQATVVKWTHKDEDTRELLVALQDGTEVSLVICDSRDVPALVNPDILLGENDLTKLSYLHEPAVLHNLRTRFTDLKQIYTYCGIVLVAVNPYQDVPIYSKDMMSAYHKLNTSEADPHVFAIGEEALRRMSRKASNQSIIVSGESGAGKTVSAKYILRYFAFISGSDGDAQIEKKVLASNPVMESIGNAKTTRNDNSSRFGKYLQIQFNKTHTIIGASLRTYLLEKTRVVSHAVSERNYHIFYQLCSAYVNRKKCESASLDDLNLGPSSEFHYLNQGQSVRIGGTDDYKDFFTTSEALGMVGISTNQKKEVFAVLAAILHLGNVEMIENDRESCDIDSHDCHLTMVSDLLGINQSDLHKWLCNKSIVMETESIVTPLTQTQSLAVRDGLAKHLYAQLFDWIVAAVNGKLSAGSDPASFIGVLDIYGFEIFGVNSFEQFCINYANEKLQQQFNMHVFKLEQEEYIKEGIDWSVISFHDNQPCIDLIEGKCGILDLIDETCKLPRGGDDMLIQKFYHSHLRKQGQLGVDQFFGKPRTSTDQFVIYHFADKVTYDVWGFVEKNMDRLIPEHLSMLKNSSNPFVCELFKTVKLNTASGTKQKRGFLGRKQGGAGGGVRAVRAGRSSVGSQFKESLGQLMSTLSSTAPHYIRCIKPNDVKEAFKFDPHRAVQQLRACGVLETIKISAMGYPSRWNYDEFFNRYRLLLPWGQVRLGETKAMSIRILNMCISEDKYCFGKSKIFFRAGQVAYLEKLRSDKLHNSSVMIQKHVKRWIQQRKYLQFRSTVIVLQSCVRGYLTRKNVEALRKTRASVVIQKWFRCYQARQHYKKLQDSVCLLQRRIRGTLGRRRYKEVLLCKKATVIQRAVKGWLARKKYRQSLRKIVKVQCCVRRWLAVRALKKLKLKARSVEHIKQLNKGLENKIIELQQKLIQKEKLEDLLQSTKLEALSWRRRAVESEGALKETAEELRMNSQVVSELTGELKLLRSELTEERQSRVHERERFEEEIRLLKEKVVELESAHHDATGVRTNQDRSIEEETSLMSPTDLADEDGYYSSRHSEIEVGDLQHEIQELKQKHQKLINEYISLQSNRQKGSSEEGVSFRTDTPTSPILIDALQSEVTRLMGENLTLREQVEDTTTPPKTRRSIRGFKNGQTSEQEDSKFLGMFSFRPEDLSSILHNIILDIKPGQTDTFGGIPCLPAHIIFMCIRYVDHCNNEDLMEEVMEGVISNIQQVTRKHAKDLDFLSFWLANTCRLCHNIAQFSGHGVKANSPRMAQIQKEFSLCNFDLAEFQHLLEQKATALYLEVARSITLRTEPLVVPALLEHNPLPGMPNIPTTPHSNAVGPEDTLDDATLESFIDRLSEVLSVLQTNCVDPLLINQLMSHVFQMINAHMLNSLLLRKDICHWTKGIQINYTISQLEDWCHEGNLGSQVMDQLQPVKEATKLLQLRKTTKKDADAVVDLCTHLTSLQVQKLLTMYTPGDFEGKVPTSLVRLIGERCCKRDGTSGRELLVHIEDSPRTTLPHTVSVLNYKKISLPSHFKLDQLLIKI